MSKHENGGARQHASTHEGFLTQQNARVAFYNEDFWKSAQFFSALALLLLSAPFGVWLKDNRPLNWSLIASGAPLMALILSVAAHKVLERTAISYYESGASVVVLERLLGLHHFTSAEGEIPTVTARRIKQGKESVAHLSTEFKGRLKGFFGTSRMSVMLRLFTVYAVVGIAEVVCLWLHGFWGINIVRLLHR